jgi:Tol biopolymer transport system component
VILRRIAAILFLPVMFAFGSGVYLFLGTLKSKVVQDRPVKPSVTKPKFVLPGTMFVVQDGRMFKLNAGNFKEIGPAGDWSQPTLTPDHTRLIAVTRGVHFSDLYLLDLDGNVVKRLTKNDSRYVEYNHWAFYPRVSPDGANLLYSYDSPKEKGVDLAVWSMPLNGAQWQARRWTDPYWYTGGDISPIPLTTGGLLFVRHSIDQSTAVHSQIYYQNRALAIAKPLTTEADDCSQPALSPDGTQLAMVCSRGKQTTALEVAPFNGTALGPARVLQDGGLYASPTWSPDGKALAYFAPMGQTGHFQLWYLPLSVAATPSATASATASPSPSRSPSHSPSSSGSASSVVVPTPTPAPTPVQVTEGVDLSATSAPVWY